MRRRLALLVGVATCAAALAGFTWLQLDAQAGEVRVLSAAHAILAGQVISANTGDLSSSGTLVHLPRGSLADAIPVADYRQVSGAVALVEIPAGAVILRHDLAMGRSADLRQVTISLASLPAGVQAGRRVDLLAVWAPQLGSATQAGDVCPNSPLAGCVVPLAQGVAVAAVDAGAHSISFEVPPDQVTAWLLLAATQPIWAVPAGSGACGGNEQAISDPVQALARIQRGTSIAAGCTAPSASRSSP